MDRRDNVQYYAPIYQTLTKEFVAQYLSVANDSKITKSKIEKFINTEVKQWNRKLTDKDANVNNIFQKTGDQIYQKNNKISVHFGAVEEILDIEITEDES